MTQKTHKIEKLSALLSDDRKLTDREVACILREIAVRLEVLGRDRRDDLIDAVSDLCTCDRKGVAAHLQVCPQSRRIEQ